MRTPDFKCLQEIAQYPAKHSWVIQILQLPEEKAKIAYDIVYGWIELLMKELHYAVDDKAIEIVQQTWDSLLVSDAMKAYRKAHPLLMKDVVVISSPEEALSYARSVNGDIDEFDEENAIGFLRLLHEGKLAPSMSVLLEKVEERYESKSRFANMKFYSFYKLGISLLVGQKGDPAPVSREQAANAVEAVIRAELECGMNPYETAKYMKPDLHEDYGQMCSGLPQPETEEEMNDSDNINRLTSWIMGREEMSTALMIMSGKIPTEEDRICISPDDEFPTVMELLNGLIQTEWD